jgi:hypothetical protein
VESHRLKKEARAFEHWFRGSVSRRHASPNVKGWVRPESAFSSQNQPEPLGPLSEFTREGTNIRELIAQIHLFTKPVKQGIPAPAQKGRQGHKPPLKVRVLCSAPSDEIIGYLNGWDCMKAGPTFVVTSRTG